AISQSRVIVTVVLGAAKMKFIFLSVATEGINTVVRGVAQAYLRKGKNIVTCQTEHKSVLTTCAQLERNGMEITYLPVDHTGAIDLQLLQKSIQIGRAHV